MSTDVARAVVQRVITELQRYRLVQRGDRVLVGVGHPASLGGLAVVALLSEAAQTLGLSELAVASIEQGPELEDGAESVADVGRIARSAGLSFFAVRPERQVELRGVIDELCRLAREQGFDRVALGHTREDAAAAALSDFARGTGVKGASGLRRREARGVIRPLLGVDAGLAAALASGLMVPVPPESRERRGVDETIRTTVLPRLRAVVPSADVGLVNVAKELKNLRSTVFSVALHRAESGRTGPETWVFDAAQGPWPMALAMRVAEVVLQACLHAGEVSPRSVKRLAVSLRSLGRNASPADLSVSRPRDNVVSVLSGGVVLRALADGTLRVEARKRT